MSNDLVQALRAAADTIDERLGPGAGGDADRFAELAREASRVLNEHDARVTELLKRAIPTLRRTVMAANDLTAMLKQVQWSAFAVRTLAEIERTRAREDYDSRLP